MRIRRSPSRGSHGSLARRARWPRHGGDRRPEVRGRRRAGLGQVRAVPAEGGVEVHQDGRRDQAGDVAHDLRRPSSGQVRQCVRDATAGAARRVEPESAFEAYLNQCTIEVEDAAAGGLFPACGDGAINVAGEQCDGGDLGGESCASLGFVGRDARLQRRAAARHERLLRDALGGQRRRHGDGPEHAGFSGS